MEKSLVWKVRYEHGDTLAVFKHLEDAAAYTAILGADAQIVTGSGTVLWHEGNEDFPAFESYDRAAHVAMGRFTD